MTENGAYSIFCPECDQTVDVVDGKVTTHDIRPYMRAVCAQSGKPDPSENSEERTS